MTQFCNLGIGRQKYIITTLSQIINFSPRFPFQYRHVNTLVDHLMRSDNVLRPLTAFKMLIISEDKGKRHSKLYDILLNEVLVIDKAKAYWE